MPSFPKEGSMNELPQNEMDAKWYDQAYALQEAHHYRGHYSGSPFKDMWEYLCKDLEPENKILDIGCGTGQLGHLLADKGIKNYIGFDFSSFAIETARKLSPGINFQVGDALTTPLLESDYDTVVSSEFIEHLNDDLKALERIKPGTMCHISTSNLACENHVRWFETADQIKERYSYLFDKMEVEKFVYPTEFIWISWIIRGIKK